MPGSSILRLCYWFMVPVFAVGLEVTIDRYPHHVALERNDINVCSGAIISSDKVLTAAHCLLDGNVSVRYDSDTILKGGKVVEVAHVRIHPLYDQLSPDYDVAVLTLEKEFEFSSTCGAVRLSDYKRMDRRTCMASGWGRLNDSVRLQKLHAVEVYEITRDECKEMWQMPLTKNVICFKNKGKLAYLGNSGGPVVDVETYELVGITSWGPLGSAHSSYPTVYTNVAALYHWINDENDVHQVVDRRGVMSAASRLKLFL